MDENQSRGYTRRQILRGGIEIGLAASLVNPGYTLAQEIYGLFQRQRSEHMVSFSVEDMYDGVRLPDTRITVYKGRRILDEFGTNTNGEVERVFPQGISNIKFENDYRWVHRRKIKVNSDRFLPIHLKPDNEELLPTPFYQQVAQTNPPEPKNKIIVTDGTCRFIDKPTFYIDERSLNPEVVKYIAQLLEDTNSPVNQFTRRWFDGNGRMWFDGKGFSYAVGTSPPAPVTPGTIIIWGDSSIGGGRHAEYIVDNIINAAYVKLQPDLNPVYQEDADTILQEILQAFGARKDSNGFVKDGLEQVVISIFNTREIKIPTFPGSFGYQQRDQRVGDFLARWPGNRYTSSKFPDDNLIIVS